HKVETAAQDPGEKQDLPKATPAYDLHYWGGGILKNPDVKNVYVGDYYKTGDGKADRDFNDGFMKYLVTNEKPLSLWHQYGVDKGSVESSSSIDGKFDKVSDKKLEEWAKGFADKEKNPNSQLIYNFVLPPGTELAKDKGGSSHAGLGGFHGSV